MSWNKGYAPEQLRLVTKVARLYHQRGLKQPEIGTRLDLSQASVSRALRDAERLGIVHITVHVPRGMFLDLETELEERYNLRSAIVVEPAGDEETDLLQAMGDGAASYLENVVPKCAVVGISSWSESLLHAVNAMRPIPKSQTEYVVQVLGGIGLSISNSVATRLTERLALVSGGEPAFLLVPGICSDADSRKAMMRERSCKHVFDFFNRIDLLLMGIGTLEPSRYLSDSGNRMTREEQRELQKLGAVGDVNQRFIDQLGRPVKSAFDSRVVGINLEQIPDIPRRLAVAGGMRKLEAIRSVLRGGYLTALVTDLEVAKALAASS